MENSSISIKYLDFLTYLYQKKYFSVSKEVRDYKIDSYLTKSLLHYNLIKGEGQNYKWVGCEPTMKEVDKVRAYSKQLRDNTRSGKEKKQKTVSAPVTQQESLFISEERAVELLKSKGYKIFKPVTEFQEI